MKSYKFISLFLCFFAMGFVDLVGVSAKHVGEEFDLTKDQTGFLPLLVFFWFLLFSIPTGVLMNKIGRKRTVLLSLVVTLASMALPLIGNSLPLMLVAFSLLGIGNTIMQTSLNPLVSSVVKGENMASTLTFGQFVKAIASFLAPILAGWVAETLGYEWRIVFLVYLVAGALATLLLLLTPIKEAKAETDNKTVAQQFKGAFALLGNRAVLLAFLGIICCVGIDVGSNYLAPVLVGDLAASVYFFARTVGCLTGAFFLRVMPQRRFFLFSVIVMFLALAALAFGQSAFVLYAGFALVGFGDSNIFPIVFARALQADGKRQNEVSALMIMGISGGGLFTPLMGFSLGQGGQVAAVAVMALGALYLLGYLHQLKGNK